MPLQGGFIPLILSVVMIFQTHLKRTCPFLKKILSADKQFEHLSDMYHLFFFCFLDSLLQFLVFPDIMPHCDKVWYYVKKKYQSNWNFFTNSITLYITFFILIWTLIITVTMYSYCVIKCLYIFKY